MESEFVPVIPGNPKIKQLIDHKSRYIPLDEIGGVKGICKWCYKVKTKTSRHRYCSNECRDSAEIYCYPQRMRSKEFHIIRQGGKCNYCSVVFNTGPNYKNTEPELDHIIPIFMGGIALGWENHHLICHLCHKKKTIRERKESKERQELVVEINTEQFKWVDNKF